MKNKLILSVFGLLILAAFAASLSLPVQAAPAAQYTVFPTPTPGPDGTIVYIVQQGDTLLRIELLFGVTVEELRRLNHLGANDPIIAGQELIIGYAGPAGATITPGPSPTPLPVSPTPTYAPGTGILCILLYNDVNGDSLREEEESSLPGGAISVSNRSGTVSQTADSFGGTDENCNTDAFTGLVDTQYGFVAFKDLPEGDYTISVAIPSGYNPTTTTNRAITLAAGDTSFVPFGAQASAKTEEEVEQVVPEAPKKSPLLGIIGAGIVLAAIALGAYALLLRRVR